LEKVIALLFLSFALYHDNFRVSIAVGTFKQSWHHALRIAIVFGSWDGVAPLIGLLIGDFLGKAIDPVAIGPIVLAVYSLYLLGRLSTGRKAWVCRWCLRRSWKSSSKMCYACGWKDEHLTLSDRIFEGHDCGNVTHRSYTVVKLA
jgi:hypothetical protein